MHGWASLTFAYWAVQAPMLAALIRGRAGISQCLASPLVAVPLAGIVGLGMLAMSPLLDQAGLMAGQVLGFMIGTSASVALGYNGGRAGAAEHRSAAKAYQRGSRVTDAPRSDRGRDALQQLASQPQRSKVTFEWKGDDLAAIYASLFRPGEPNYKFFDLPIANYASSSYDRVMLGEGIADLPRVIANLRSIGYGGPLSLELFNRTLWEHDPAEVARRGLDRLRALVEA